MANKKSNLKLTLNRLIAKKKQKENSKIEFRNYFVKSLEGEIVIKKPDRELILEAMDAINEDESVTKIYEINKNLIYSCVKILHEDELQTTYECKSPDDIVDELFEVEEVLEIGSFIMDWNGSFETVDKEIKNS
ncbi:hypothetical protein [Helicovermis profundi]|uniref:Uncharacterized protein n=1 Tax=Helicovermis profundi TaxID=3065157 RepID=A0AAU9E2I2_9FIRM|nr:hypothetical protein HLPR_11470 [Clostridia bacterium S502]